MVRRCEVRFYIRQFVPVPNKSQHSALPTQCLEVIPAEHFASQRHVLVNSFVDLDGSLFMMMMIRAAGGDSF